MKGSLEPDVACSGCPVVEGYSQLIIFSVIAATPRYRMSYVLHGFTAVRTSLLMLKWFRRGLLAIHGHMLVVVLLSTYRFVFTATYIHITTQEPSTQLSVTRGPCFKRSPCFKYGSCMCSFAACGGCGAAQCAVQSAQWPGLHGPTTAMSMDAAAESVASGFSCGEMDTAVKACSCCFARLR